MKKWTSLLLALAMDLFPGRLRQFQSGKYPGAAGICQRLHNRRNTLPPQTRKHPQRNQLRRRRRNLRRVKRPPQGTPVPC